jgi:hypothetical protein
MEQVVDPAVSLRKFEREVAEYRSLEDEYRSRGWILVKADFPEVLVLLAAPRLKPIPVVTGVRLDYSDYDLRPPSVKLVDPFTGEPYKASALPTNMLRAVEQEAPFGGAFPGVALPLGAQAKFVTHQPLMQAYGPEEEPFLCLAGVREYHDHPGHSGDAWELHRPQGAGRLVRLLGIIAKYGVDPISDYQVGLVPQVNGFVQGDVPA